MMKKIVLWILVIACMVTIFFFSSQEAKESSKVSANFIVSIIRFFNVKEVFSETQIEEISIAFNSFVRIVAHFIIYGVLGFLIALLLGEYKVLGIKQLYYSLLWSTIYSCTDEIHQSFVPGRSAQISDIITDALGALSGAALAVIISLIIRNLKKKHHTD